MFITAFAPCALYASEVKQSKENLLLSLKQEYDKADKKSLLKPLTEEQQKAGVEGNQYYDATLYESLYKGLMFGELHKRGNVMDKGELASFFLRSIFRFYTHELLNFDMTADYDFSDGSLSVTDNPAQVVAGKSYPSYKNSNTTFKKMISELSDRFSLHIDLGKAQTLDDLGKESIEKLSNTVTAIQNAIEQFRKNQLLLQLGVVYQRHKIVVEKINAELEEKMAQEEDVSAVYDRLVQEDRVTTDLQAMIFYMMKEAYEKFMQNYGKKVKKPADFLQRFEPSFVQVPYYKMIIKNLDELQKPVK